ncbi:MAG: hypothetical protein R3C13_02755 [Hyphomonas sp.]|uniref:hypothetical protein n=1 Tax=Hyphomonas sp. TaxID=87 RepID=UPI003529553B
MGVLVSILSDPFFQSVLLASVGGVVAGLAIARLSAGNMTGALLGGMIGGLAAHFGLAEAGLDAAALTGMALRCLRSLLEGAAGGAALGWAAGFLMKPKG